jgi:L-ascorbate metabolism protein UlaG (beta-lactamase superfamily)
VSEAAQNSLLGSGWPGPALGQENQPDNVVVNAGGTRFTVGAPITITAAEGLQTARFAPQATVYAVHVGAVNHAPEDRALVRALAAREGLSSRVFALNDGEWATL